jgi:prolyl-tRNA synthetase
VKSDVGMMGGKLAHEFMCLSPIGEDTLLLCDTCGYSANRQIALFKKPAPAAEAPQAVEKVATPETKTIEALAQLLNLPKAKTAKAVFLIAVSPGSPDKVAAFGGMRADGAQEQRAEEERFIFAIVRGDMA